MVDGMWGGRGYLVRAVGGWVIQAPPLCPTGWRTRSWAGRVFTFMAEGCVMTKEEFLQRLIELCKQANVKLDQFSQFASVDEHYQTGRVTALN